MAGVGRKSLASRGVKRCTARSANAPDAAFVFENRQKIIARNNRRAGARKGGADQNDRTPPEIGGW
jgi:hypothetical protein